MEGVWIKVEELERLKGIEDDYKICKHSLENLKHDLIAKNARINELKAPGYWRNCHDIAEATNMALRNQIRKLEQQRDELQRDADRYRLIRAHAGSAMDWDWWTLAKHNHDGLDASDLLDAAIDAAIAKVKEQK